MLVKPEIMDYSNLVEMDIVEPIIADWMESEEMKTISDYRDHVELQIIYIKLTDTSENFSVYVSDGLHYIDAMIDRKLNNDFITETIDVFDIVHVLKSTGHPANDNFILVILIEHSFYC